jgi:hypothetical protein
MKASMQILYVWVLEKNQCHSLSVWEKKMHYWCMKIKEWECPWHLSAQKDISLFSTAIVPVIDSCDRWMKSEQNCFAMMRIIE